MNTELIKENCTIVQVLKELKDRVTEISYFSRVMGANIVTVDTLEDELNRLIKLYGGKE